MLYIYVYIYIYIYIIYINRKPVNKTRPLSSYQLTHDKVMQTWTSDIHAAARQEPVFMLYSTQSSSYIYRLYSTNKRLLLYSYIYLIPYYVHNLSMHLLY